MLEATVECATPAIASTGIEWVGRCTFNTVVAGIQCVSRSYSFARTSRIRAGERSSIISFAMTSIRASQSGGGIAVLSVTLSLWSYQLHVSTILPPLYGTYFCACTDSNINNARLRFLPLSFAILLSNGSQLL